MSAVATPLVIGVTSHRNLCAAEVELLREHVKRFFALMQRTFPGLPLVVLTSLAEGGDQLVAEEALRTGARLVAPFPFARELYQQDFAGPGHARFESLSQRAEILELPLVPGNADIDIVEHGDARNRQYAQAGVFVASHSHILLALWDGRDSERLGGTAQVVRYHLDGIMPGWIERRHSRRVLLESGDESLLYHIACSRRDDAGQRVPPLSPLQTGQARWISQQRTTTSEVGMPEEFRRMFINMQQFNDDAARYAGDIKAGAHADGASEHFDCTALDSLFAAADWLAVHFRTRVLWAMRGLYVLATLMGMAFVCYSDLPSGLPYVGDAIYVFVALFTAGVYLAWLARKRHWHRKYIDYRALAEGLRVQCYWRRTGVDAGDPGRVRARQFHAEARCRVGMDPQRDAGSRHPSDRHRSRHGQRSGQGDRRVDRGCLG